MKSKKADRQGRAPSHLGDILVQMGLLSADDFHAVLTDRHTEKLLGDQLLAMQLIQPEQLEQAREIQKKLNSGRRHLEATARADIARCGFKAVAERAQQVRRESGQLRRAITSKDHPAVAQVSMAPPSLAVVGKKD